MRIPALLLSLSGPLLFSACTLRAADADSRALPVRAPVLPARTAVSPEKTVPAGASTGAQPVRKVQVPRVTVQEDGTDAEGQPLPADEPPPEGKVKWASPARGAVLFRPGTATLDWTSTFPAGSTYSVTMGESKSSYPTVLGDRITETHLEWPLPDLPKTNFWLRVKAMDATGRMLGEDTVPVHLLPKDAIVVSKTNQTLWAFQGGRLRQRYMISTGEGGYDTRAGWFQVYSREKLHRSRLYDVDMPYALFFSGGQAIHASTALRRLGSPASHGCVRLPRRHARALYDESTVGRPVIVTRWGQDMSFLDRLRSTQATRGATRSAATNTRTRGAKGLKPVLAASPARRTPPAVDTAPDTSTAVPPAAPHSHLAGR